MSSQVWNSFQDKFGYIWVATNEGIARFDGYIFHPYFNDLANEIHLKKASNFFEDSDGELWVISGDGYLNKYDRQKDRFFHKKTPFENGWSEQSPHQIFEDSLKNFWIGAYGGFQYYDRKNDKINAYPISAIRDTAWPHEEKLRIGAFVPDVRGNIWAGERKFGFIKFNSKTKKYHLYRFDSKFNKQCFVDWITDIVQIDKNTLIISEFGVGLVFWDTEKEKILKIIKIEELANSPSAIDVRDMFLENNKHLWLATDNNGIMLYDIKANKILATYQKNQTQGLSLGSNRIRHINKDRSGNFWIASNTLEIANPKFYQFKEWFFDPLNPQSLLQDNIYSLFPTKDKKILASTRLGLSIFDLKSETFDNHYPPNKSEERSFGALEAKDNSLWVGHYDRISKFDPKQKKEISRVACSTLLDNFNNDLKISLRVFEDSRGVIWTINQWGRLNYIDPKTNKAGSVFDLAQDPISQKFVNVFYVLDDPEHQQILVGTDLGLATVSYENNKVERKSLKINKLDLSNLLISYLYRDKSNKIWAIIEGRTYQIDAKTFKVTPFDLASTYQVESFKWIVEEPRGVFWLSCYKGIIKYDNATKKSTIFFSSNIGDYTTDSPSPVAQTGGKIFFAGNKGLTMIEPFKTVESETKPILNIESVTYSKSPDSPITLEKVLLNEPQIELDYFQNKLVFKFVGLHFEDPANMKYAYKLEGYDKDWVQANDKREAVYTNLARKSYVFKVKAIVNNNQSSENAASLKVIINPPFWQTWWAFLVYLAAIATSIYFYIKFRVKRRLQKIRETEAIRVSISSNLHDDVGSILSGLSMQSQMLAITSLPDQKKSLLEISEMCQDAMERMRDTVWAIDSRKDKYENLIDKMREYAEKNFHLRKINHQFTADVDDSKKFINPEKRQNVYLIFKEAITNICKHSNCKQVNVYFKQEKDNFVLKIEDNGTNTLPLISEGSGLNNMKMRAKNIGADLIIDSSKGFKVTLGYPTL